MWFVCMLKQFEPEHDKINKMTCAPSKTPISLGTRPVLSESSMCALMVAKVPTVLHRDCEDWLYCADGQADRWAIISFCWFWFGRAAAATYCDIHVIMYLCFVSSWAFELFGSLE